MKTTNTQETLRTDVLSEQTWRIGVAVIFCIAAVLRVYYLNLVPLHHDEGVNGNFLVRLVRDGFYHYDPANYHGPSLYYLAAVYPWIIKLIFGAAARDKYGLTTVTIRLIPALFGIGTIGLIFLLRRNLGTIATLVAALLLAISPGAVYLSRYFIHETLFVFFTVGIVVAAIKLYETHQPFYLMMVFVSAAMVFATKETSIISFGVLAIAWGTKELYLKIVRKPPVVRTGKKGPKPPGYFKPMIEGIGGTRSLIIWLLLGTGVFVSINILFYSSFFTNWQGVFDSLRTFEFWSKTGGTQHVHPPQTYLTWLFAQESPLLILGCVGAAFCVLRPRNSFALFCSLWAFGLIAAYSLLAYKTPWLTLNFLAPLALVSGYAIQAVYEMNQPLISAALVLLAVGVNGYQTLDLNFRNYDNDSSYYVYVYAHTRRETKELVDKIDQIAAQTHQGDAIGITIVSQDYWPLPWYLRDYTRVGYFGRMTPSTEPLILASETQRNEMESNFGGSYQLVPSTHEGGAFTLRPGVQLLLYQRRATVP